MNKEFKKAALAVFEAYPNAKEVYITPDGQVFLAIDRARLHNKEVVTVKRSEVIEEAPIKLPTDKKSAEQLIADMPSVATIAELDVLAKGEKRKTVLDAIEAQRTVLTAKQA